MVGTSKAVSAGCALHQREKQQGHRGKARVSSCKGKEQALDQFHVIHAGCCFFVLVDCRVTIVLGMSVTGCGSCSL